MQLQQNSKMTLSRLRTLLLLILFIGVSDLSAQGKLKFSIADFDTDPFDLSAKDKQYEKYDGNGERYAIIKVSSNNPDDNLSEYNFNFGNMKHIVEEHDGVLWLYVQRNAKLVTITRNGYAPINKYDLHTTIESGKNYVMSITSEEKKVYTQMVQFNIKPATIKAIVMVKSYKEGSQEELFGNADGTGAVAKSLEYGTYTYKVLADNYHMAEGRFTLNNRSETLIEDVNLRPNFSDITLKVDADADIYINGEKKGTRQWSGILKTGNYQVECRQANHKTSSQYIQVEENDNRTIELTAPEPILGTVAITSAPLGAEIQIDGKVYGQTPTNIDLIIGKHTIEISKMGYKSERKSFEVEEKRTANINISLERRTTAIIDSKPSNAEIYIDGTFKGNTPYTYEGETGDHHIRLLRKGYKPIEKKIYFGNTDHMSFPLKKRYVKRSDFYIGAGFCSTLSSEMNVAATASMGTHIANFNFEVGYSYWLSGKSTTIHWYLKSGRRYNDHKCKYHPILILNGKIGYGFILGRHFKITPQIGYSYVGLKESQYNSYDYDNEVVSLSNTTIGLRIYCAISSHFGISLTPEYAIGVGQSNGYKALSNLSSTIKDMGGEGFSTKLALVLTL